MAGKVLTRAHILSDLRSLGVAYGDHLALGVSFKSLGDVEDGPETLINALLDAVGPEGTIMIPTFTPLFWLSAVMAGHTPVFDYSRTSAYTGVVPEHIRARPRAIRSRHPSNSVAAIGALAQFLTEDHEEHAPAYLPYSRLAEVDGKILCIGIGDRLVGLNHEAQYRAGLLEIVPRKSATWYRDRDGEIQLFRRKDPGGCVKRLTALVSVLRQHDIVQDGTIGPAGAVLVLAKPGLQIMTDLLRADPTLNLCDHVGCLWCRELERRLGLRQYVSQPRYFQRYKLIAWFVDQCNRLRLEDYRFVMELKRWLSPLRRMLASR